MNDGLIQAQVEQEYAAKMMAQRMGSAAGSAIDALNRPTTAPADFHSLLARVRQATMEASETRAHSASIADTMHGHSAEECGADCARDQRVGLIGQYEDALDELMAALSDTRSNLRRISRGIPDAPKSSLA